MKYQEFIPGNELKQYIKCYYIFESDTNAVYEDKAFATGCIEIMFNLGTGSWETACGGNFKATPDIELWGQIIQPLTFKSLGKNTMFGIRFFPHTASIFLNHDISLFNNQVTDLIAVAGKPVLVLHRKLMDTVSLNKRIELVEQFLMSRLSAFEKKLGKTNLIGCVINELKREDFFDNIENVASQYGITARYLQKLFVQHTGLTPKLFHKINRFQNSLLRVRKSNDSLTSIAHECGYFDQSHFIRDFKFFTGSAPSGYNPGNSSAIVTSLNK